MFELFCHRLYFTGTESSAAEDRLRQHLFNPAYQLQNLRSIPISGINETIDVSMRITLTKIIDVVN